MQLPDFKLERYFSAYEFNAPYLLCCSDCESITIADLLDLEGAQAWEAFGRISLGYTEAPGGLQLRRSIAGLYTRMDEGNILVTSGAEEAIFLFMNSVLKPGDHIIVQFPAYQSLFEIARAIGCDVTRWELREDEGWKPNLDFLRQSIKGNTRAIVINSPHNPTGYQMSKAEQAAIVEIAREHGIIVFSDEVYRYLEYEMEDRLEATCDLYENAVSLGVMSKSYGLAGLRIGWIATSNREVFKRMAAFKDYTSICNSAPSEFLANLALKHHDQLVNRNLTIIKDNLQVLNDFFFHYEHLFSWKQPKAGPISFPRIKWEENVEAFCSALVADKGVLLLPGTCYDYGNRHFRIGFGRKNLPEGIQMLQDYLTEKY